MKKHFLTFAACLLAFGGLAKDLSPEQMQLRKDVFTTLRNNGYADADIDKDGDVTFTKDGIKYWVLVNENWSDPYNITVYTRFIYDEPSDYTRENVEGCLSVVNQFKTVKLYCDDRGYDFRTDILCRDAEVFSQTLQAILKEQEKAQQYVSETIASGLGGLDLTGDKETLMKVALLFYLAEDYTKAFKLTSHLADAGYPSAYSMLAIMYQNGEGVKKNEAKMVENYEKAVENGVAWCGYNLGMHYYDKQQYGKALDYFTMTSASDNSSRCESFYMVGKMNEEGTGVAKNMAQAIRNYRKSVQYSDKLESDARLALIRLGERVEDPAEFIDIPKSLLSDMTADDMYTKGFEYENGENNREISLPKAYGYYKAAADRNNTKAILKMGELYISRFYPFNDKSKSDKYYAKAFKALKQQESFSGDANHQLGMMYKNGLGVEKNRDLAMSYFKTASGKGVAESSYELGLILKDMLEYVEAFNCFRNAAEHDCAPAMLEVAKAYESGLGTSKSKDKAIEWYLKCENTDTPSSREASEILKGMRGSAVEKE